MGAVFKQERWSLRVQQCVMRHNEHCLRIGAKKRAALLLFLVSYMPLGLFSRAPPPAAVATYCAL